MLRVVHEFGQLDHHRHHQFTSATIPWVMVCQHSHCCRGWCTLIRIPYTQSQVRHAHCFPRVCMCVSMAPKASSTQEMSPCPSQLRILYTFQYHWFASKDLSSYSAIYVQNCIAYFICLPPRGFIGVNPFQYPFKLQLQKGWAQTFSPEIFYVTRNWKFWGFYIKEQQPKLGSYPKHLFDSG